ncbi:MAG: ABC transporter ATP-binding protein [Lachnospiraceae bacterium]|jgi:peptide/nickel transport system ATP-binding protein|nr:ABC transporter ATP-binding protein [Lachnospiraceae bacterium]
MSEKLLEIKNLHVMYKTDEDDVYALNGIDLDLDKGETLGLVGETGAGKTTIALSILKLLPERTGFITQGEILFEGRDVVNMKEEEMRMLRGNDISMIFADPMSALNPLHTVGKQIAEVIELHNTGMSHGEIEKKVDEMMELVGIPAERKTEYPHQFSGGMRQRIVIAIALSCTPRLLLADEPTTALDVTIQAQVLKMMDDLKERLNTAMIMITHDLGVVAQICNKVAIIYAGEIVEYGKIEDIYEGERHHPYTVGLFGSIPDITSNAERLTPIDGLMPDPTKPIPGCRFADRCPSCMDICSRKSPGMVNFDGHQIKCFLYESGEEN